MPEYIDFPSPAELWAKEKHLWLEAEEQQRVQAAERNAAWARVMSLNYTPKDKQ